jgi:TatD DNase family protein
VPTRLIDFHCHLDLYPNHAQAVAECDRQEVFTLAVTTTPRAWPRNYELASGTKHVRTALGLHPQLVKDHANELGLWCDYLSRARYIGEVGLDAGPQYFSSFGQQRHVFQTILSECADKGGKILTIHSVRAAKAVLDMIEAHFPRSRGTAVLHWFTGSKSEAQRAVELGCYFSINLQMLRNDRHRSTVALLPHDRLLTETDGPFGKIDGRNARPSDVSKAVEELARCRAMPPSDMAETLLMNLKRVVSEG